MMPSSSAPVTLVWAKELEWAAHLSLQACILPLPRTLDLANYARILNQARMQPALPPCAAVGHFSRSTALCGKWPMPMYLSPCL